MNEINSMQNSKNNLKKNNIIRKVKNLKQNFYNNQNKFNVFQTKSGKTAEVSPINFHNKLIGYINANKTNLNIPTMNSKYNKNYVLEKSKSNTRAKSNKKSKSKKAKEPSRNIKQNINKRYNKVNTNKNVNFIHSISHVQNNIKSKGYFQNITQYNSNNHTKIKNIKLKNKRDKKNKILQRNLLINDNNSRLNNNTNFNLITSSKQSHNLKVMKKVKNIFEKKNKDINIKKNSISAINSRKNTNSKDKKNKKIYNNKSHYINKVKNTYNNNKVIKNLKTKTNINNISSKKKSNRGSIIVRNIVVFSNEKSKNKYQSIINKDPVVQKENKNNKKNNNNYNYLKSENFTQTTNNIKSKQNNNNNLLNSYINNLIKIKSEQNSKSKEKSKTNLKNKIINNKMNNNILNKYNNNLNSNYIYKPFPLTSTNTKNIINYKKTTKTKNKTKSKSTCKTSNYNNYNNNKKTKTKFDTSEKRKSKSQSTSKNKSKHKSYNKYKEHNNIFINRYSTNKKHNIIINIGNNFNKKNKINRKYNQNKKNESNKRNTNNINNFIINIFPNKSTYPESTQDFQKTVKEINLTTSLLQNNSKRNKYTNTKSDKSNLSSNNIKKLNSNNYTKDELPLLINNKDSFYYNDISKKLSEKIRQYGKEHNYNEYPKTDLTYYQIGRSIGHGAFGKVNIALHILSGHIVCIKSFNKKKNTFSFNRIKNEVKIMRKLRNSDNIVKLFELFETKDYYCLVMENVVGGNLLNAINKMNKIPENLSKIIFKQVMLTLQYIHSNNIVHRDIKPDNILLDLDNTIKLCDFGVSKIITPGQLINDSCGTPAFIAPEILLDTPYNPYFTDIWSCGVVLYAMVTGFFPFRGINETQLHESILSGVYPKPKDNSEELNDLLSRILNTNPNKRISLEMILGHPWLNSCDNYLNKNLNLNLNLFTKAEKIIYGKLKLNYKKINQGIQMENFTNKNIDSYYEEENKNVQTMSIVFTPYNSNREKDGDEDLYYDDVNIEDEIIKFTPKVQEISRLYEIHNNYDYDQGYIIEKKELWRRKLKVSIKNSFENDKNINIKDSNKKDVSGINNNFWKINTSMNLDNFIIDEEAIKYVENFGYKKEYVVKSIESNELNHASATYYLKLSLKK